MTQAQLHRLLPGDTVPWTVQPKKTTEAKPKRAPLAMLPNVTYTCRGLQ